MNEKQSSQLPINDKVIIRDLEVWALIGVYESERHEKQRLILNVEFWTDLSAAARSDDLAHTINYGRVVELAEQLAANSSYLLLEAFADDLHCQIAAEMAFQKIRIDIAKPDIFAQATFVGITLERLGNLS